LPKTIREFADDNVIDDGDAAADVNRSHCHFNYIPYNKYENCVNILNFALISVVLLLNTKLYVCLLKLKWMRIFLF
jgi:hypothetical protein